MRKKSQVLIIIMFGLCSVRFGFAQDDAKSYFQKGLEYQKEGNADLALKEYERAITLEPYFSDALFNAAIIHLSNAPKVMGKEEWQKAVDMFERVVILKPNDGEAYYHLAVAYYGLGKFPEAIKYNDESLELGFPGTEEFRSWLLPFRYKEIELEYMPVLAKPNEKAMIKIKGNSQIQGELLSDVIGGLESFEQVSRKGMFRGIDAESSMEWEGVERVHYEKWTILGSDNRHNQYMIRFVSSPDGGTDFQIRELR